MLFWQMQVHFRVHCIKSKFAAIGTHDAGNDAALDGCVDVAEGGFAVKLVLQIGDDDRSGIVRHDARFSNLTVTGIPCLNFVSG